MNLFNKKIESHQISTPRATENIIPPKEMKKVISDVFDDLSRMIAYTIGPCGGNTLVTEPYALTPIFPTKDGFEVMNNHIYNDIPYESIYRVIRDISGRMNEAVGDGTTSGVIIAADLYKRITKYLANHKDITPYGAKKLLDVIYDKLVEEFKSYNYVVDTSKLSIDEKVKVFKKIATISANNDSDIGGKVASVYEKSQSEYTFVDIQDSSNENDVIETNLGFELTSGYILRHMANNADGITAEYSDPLFLLVDGPITPEDTPQVEKMIETACVRLQRPFVIFASEFCKECMDMFVHFRTAYPMQDKTGRQVAIKLPILAIMLNTGSEYGISRIQDLEACLGAKAIQTNTGRMQNCPTTDQEFMLLVGRADSIKCVPYYTRIRGGAGTQAERQARIDEIERLIKENADAAQHGTFEQSRIDMLRRRAGMLKGEMHCIKVGGNSYKEKKTRHMIYDDAVQAVKACVNNGISLGGNVSISHCINHHKDEIIDAVMNTVTAPGTTYNVMINSTPDKLRRAVECILNIVSESSLAAFKAVFNNATNNKRWVNKIFKTIKTSDSVCTYNLISGKTETLENVSKNISNQSTDVLPEFPDLIVPGNTDSELLKSVFCIIGLFITSNQLISLIPQSNSKR